MEELPSINLCQHNGAYQVCFTSNCTQYIKRLGLVMSRNTDTVSPARTSGTNVSKQDGSMIESMMDTNTTQSLDEALVDINGQCFLPSASPQSLGNSADTECSS